MSNYTQNVTYGPKDSLSTGDPDKAILGTQFDAEFSEIATAIASKEDTANKGQASGYASLDGSSKIPAAQLPAATESAVGGVELATTAEVVTGTDTARAVTPAGVEAWAAQNGGMVQDISNLADPNADRVLGWDDSAGAAIAYTIGTGLTTSTTNLTTDDSAIVHDNLSGFVANEHIDHSSVTLTAGDGLTGGGTIAASRTFNVVGTAPIVTSADAVTFNVNGLSALEGNAVAGADEFYISDGGTGKKMLWQGSGIPITTTSAAATPASSDANRLYVLTGSTNRAFTLNTSVGVPGNFFILTCTGTGLWTLAGTSTRTSAVGTTGIRAQYSVIVLLCIAANTWIIFGDAT